MSARIVDIRSEKRKEVLESIGWEQFLMPVGTATAGAVLLHGYDDDSSKLAPIKAGLKKCKVSYVAPDLPGHGVSANGNPGYFDNILELELVGRSLTLYMMKSLEQRKTPVFLVGFSMGAVVILSLLINHPVLRNCVAGVILINTPLEVSQNARLFLRRLRFGLTIASRTFGKRMPPEFFYNEKLRNGRETTVAGDASFGSRPPNRVIDELYDASLYVQENIHRLNHVPICAIHGTKDLKTDFAMAEKSFKALARAQFFSLEGLAHYPWGTEFEEQIVSLTCDWIKDRIDARRNS